MRAVLARPDFRLFFVAVVATMVGESALLLVLAIWVKELTGSSSLAGATLFALALPSLAAPVLGWVVDRFRRRPFLIATLLTTAVVLLPLMLVRGPADIWIIFVVAVCLGISMIMASATTAGLIKEMLPDELLADANGALQTVRQGLRLVAPIGGAALFGVLGGRAVAALDIVCLLIGAATMVAVKIREERPERSELHWLGEVVAGVRNLFGPPALRRATLGLALGCSVIGFTETLIFQYVDLGLHRGPAFISLIVCVQGIGGLTGGLIAARVVRAQGELATTAIGVLLMAVGFGVFAYPNMITGFAGAILAGAGIPLTLVGFNTLLIRTTPHALMGRVNAAAEAIISTPQSLSIAGGAALALVVDYRLLFVIMGAIMVTSAGYLWAGRGLTPQLPAAGPASTETIPAQAEAVRVEQSTTP